MPFNTSTSPSYQNQIEGNWGLFSSEGGEVAFLTTRAQLGVGGTDPEHRLTSHLRPVREILETDALNFNQLLQRDLDDHRVAIDLIPYILESQPTGPAFFPPVVAVLLPFNANEPAETFPPEGETNVSKGLYDVDYQTRQYGDAYQVETLWDPQSDAPHPIKLGRLSWNEERAKLVVIDGQHRAMALLAIDRTVNKSWGGSSGSRYRHFYEHRVERLLADNPEAKERLGKLQFPVTICWFPKNSSPHRAARKLFVDLNKEARKPSEARLILLSDEELANVFARGILNELRSTKGHLPIYAVEYDNPDANFFQPTRWSVLTNIHFIKSAVIYSVFCPERYVTDMSQRISGGRPPWEEMNTRMRRQLDLGKFLPGTIYDEDRIIDRSAIKNDYFPQGKTDDIRDKFMESWGHALLNLISETKPYRAHWQALQELKDNWAADDSISSLAFEALFAGMGMYWTLRDSHDYWLQQVSEARKQKQPVPSKPDIVKAWEALEAKRADFEALRAMEYLGSASSERVTEANSAYNVFNTHACQLGLVLALTTLAESNSVRGTDLILFAKSITTAANAALNSEVNSSRNRLRVLDPTVSKPINRIAKMDTPLAIQFRYFWLELLCLDEPKELLAKHVDTDSLVALRDAARRNYYRYLVKERVKALRRTNPELSDAKARRDAEQEERKLLGRSLKFWFDVEDEEYAGWTESYIDHKDQQDNEEHIESDEELETEDDLEYEDIDSYDKYDEIARDMKS